MKRNLINAVCVAIVALGSTTPGATASATSTQSPYLRCMEACMATVKNATFEFCHGECREIEQ